MQHWQGTFLFVWMLSTEQQKRMSDGTLSCGLLSAVLNVSSLLEPKLLLAEAQFLQTQKQQSDSRYPAAIVTTDSTAPFLIEYPS